MRRSIVNELAMCGTAQTGQQYSATDCRRRLHDVGARAPVRPVQLPHKVVWRGEFCARLHTVVSAPTVGHVCEYVMIIKQRCAK